MNLSDDKAIKTGQWFPNEILRDDDINFVGEATYQNITDQLALTATQRVIDEVVSGLLLTPDTLMTLSLSAGAAMSFSGSYLTGGAWGFTAGSGDVFSVINPVDEEVAISTADPTNPRIDVVEIRPVEIPYDSKARQFKDPVTGLVSTATVNIKKEYGIEIQVSEGTVAGSPVANATTTGWIKLAEVTVPALATVIGAGDIKTYKESDTWDADISSTTWDSRIVDLAGVGRTTETVKSNTDGISDLEIKLSGIEDVLAGEAITAFDPVGLVDDEWIKSEIKLRDEVLVTAAGGVNYSNTRSADIGNGRFVIAFGGSPTNWIWAGIYEYVDGALSELVAPTLANAQIGYESTMSIIGLSADYFMVAYQSPSNAYGRIGHYAASTIVWDTPETILVAGAGVYLNICRSGLTGNDFYMLYRNGGTNSQMRLGYLNSTVIAWRAAATTLTSAGIGNDMQSLWLHNDGIYDIYLNVFQNAVNSNRLEYIMSKYTAGTLTTASPSLLLYEPLDVPAAVYPYVPLIRIDSQTVAISLQANTGGVKVNVFQVWEFHTHQITTSTLLGVNICEHRFQPNSTVSSSSYDMGYMPITYFEDTRTFAFKLQFSTTQLLVFRWTGTSLECLGFFDDIAGTTSTIGAKGSMTALRDTPGLIASVHAINGSTAQVQVYQIPLYDGIALEAAIDGANFSIQRKGEISGISGLTPRKVYSVDYHTATLTPTVPGERIGRALSATQLLLD